MICRNNQSCCTWDSDHSTTDRRPSKMRIAIDRHRRCCDSQYIVVVVSGEVLLADGQGFLDLLSLGVGTASIAQVSRLLVRHKSFHRTCEYQISASCDSSENALKSRWRETKDTVAYLTQTWSHHKLRKVSATSRFSAKSRIRTYSFQRSSCLVLAALLARLGVLCTARYSPMILRVSLSTHFSAHDKT